jgi:hypothetical protein
LAGITEVALKDHYADKANWRKMLTNSIEHVDLVEERLKLEKYCQQKCRKYFFFEQKMICMRCITLLSNTKVKV